jgi:hypothetical protein
MYFILSYRELLFNNVTTSESTKFGMLEAMVYHRIVQPRGTVTGVVAWAADIRKHPNGVIVLIV